MSFGVFILAGGNGTRLGQKKAFLKLGNSSLLDYTHNVATKLTTDIVIIINGLDKTKKELQSLPNTTSVINDIHTGVGPIMGMLSGLKHASCDNVLILPCDTPFLNIELLRYLLSLADENDAVIPQWDNGFIEPLHSVYRTESAVRAIEEALHNGEKSVLDLIKRLNRVKYVPVDDLKRFDPELLTFRNINYLEDYEKAQEIVKKRNNLQGRSFST